MYGPGTRISDFIVDFPAFDGCTLTLWGLGVSHGEMHLTAALVTGDTADLCFLGLRYLDCPITMRNARLRMANDIENEMLRHLMIPMEHDLFSEEWVDFDLGIGPQYSHLRIECVEGVFSVVADALFLTLSEKPKLRFMQIIPDRLWEGAPTLDQL